MHFSLSTMLLKNARMNFLLVRKRYNAILVKRIFDNLTYSYTFYLCLTHIIRLKDQRQLIFNYLELKKNKLVFSFKR